MATDQRLRQCCDLTEARWQAMDSTQKRATVVALVAELGETYEAVDPDNLDPHSERSVRHRPTGVLFRLIGGGRFTMGMSGAEWKRLEKKARSLLKSNLATMQPVKEVDVAPFLAAAEPLTLDELRSLMPALPPGVRDPERELVGGWRDPKAELFAGCVDLGALPTVETALGRAGWRLPSEAQWEYAARAGADSLYVSGSDDEPSGPRPPINQVGLGMLAELPEVCADGWNASHEGAPTTAEPRRGEGRVYRGGAAYSWPWQACHEWLVSLCAFRSPVELEPLAIRPVILLFEDVAYTDEARSVRHLEGTVARDKFSPSASLGRLNSGPGLQNLYGRALVDFSTLDDETDAHALLMEIHRRHVVRRFEVEDVSWPLEVPIVSAIMTRLAAGAVPGRSALILLLADVLWRNHARRLPWPGAVKRDQLARVVKFGKVLEALVADELPDVRATAPLLVATAGPPATVLFAAQLAKESVPTVRASLIVGLGVAARGSPRAEIARETLEQALAGASQDLERAAALIGLATLDGAEVLDRHPDELQIALGIRLPAGSPYPWNHGDVAAHVLRLKAAGSNRSP